MLETIIHWMLVAISVPLILGFGPIFLGFIISLTYDHFRDYTKYGDKD